MTKRWIVGAAVGASVVGASVLAAPFVAAGAGAPASPTVTPRVVIPEVSSDRDIPEIAVNVSEGASTATLDLRVAATTEERARGLMWITEMPADAGMIFVFPADTTEGFWMENTYLPLDIAFISGSGQLIAVLPGKPLDTTVLKPGARYRYAIETNVGWWSAHGFSAGAQVTLPAGLGAP